MTGDPLFHQLLLKKEERKKAEKMSLLKFVQSWKLEFYSLKICQVMKQGKRNQT